MAVFTLRVLSALEFFIGDEPKIISFRSDKVRALLIYLALEAERPHRRRALVALLWPEFSESAGLSNLRKTLYYLRGSLNQLSPHASESLLTVNRQTVQLNPIDLVVDAVQFEQLLAEVAQHDHRHLFSCDNCLARLITAQSLYRGELLPGFSLADAPAFNEWLLVKQELLQQKAILLLQNLVDIYEQKNEAAHVEKYATRLTRLEPYHEKAVRQLMRVLTKTNRRHMALQVYQRLTDRLQADIGVTPEERTSQLFQQIEAGTFLETVTASQQLHHFPTQFTPFLGRKTYLAQANRFLKDADCHLLTIVGAGGIGKTRLAIEAAKQAAKSGRFADGIYFADLVVAASRDDLLAALAATLYLQPRANVALKTQILDFLKSRRCLLLLDNFEHLAGNELLIAEMLTAAPRLTLLVTSRQPLYLRAEQQLRLEGLSYPQESLKRDELIGVTEALIYDAVRFFAQSAQRVRPDFAVTAANVGAIMSLSSLTQGSPLALEIAAVWVQQMQVTAIVSTLARSLDFLASPIRDMPERQRSMRAVFDYSWHLLTPPEKLTLAKISIFRESFMRATAVAVLETNPSELNALLDKSLLQNPTPDHYGLHAMLRQYLLDKLRETDNGTEIERRTRQKHSDHYLTFVAQTAAAFYGPEPQAAATAMRQRLGNVTQAWWWAVEHLDAAAQRQMIGRCVDGLGRFYTFWGLVADGERLLRGAVEKVELLLNAQEIEEATAVGATTIATLFSHLLAWQAYFQNGMDEVDTAVQTAKKSLAYGKHSPAAVARAKSLLGKLLPHFGEFKQAEDYLQAALLYYQAVGDEAAQAQALKRLGIAQRRQGHLPQALPTLTAGLAIQETLGNKAASAHLCSEISGVYYEKRDIQQAQEYVQKARLIFTEIGDEIGVARTDAQISALYRILGQYEAALAANQKALDVYRRLGDRREMSFTLLNRAGYFADQGNLDAAIDCYLEGIRLTEELNLPWNLALQQAHMASVLLDKGEEDQAMALYAQTIPVLREHGAKLFVVHPLLRQGETFLVNGRLSAAQTSIQEALAVAEEIQYQPYILAAHILAARLIFLQGAKGDARQQLYALLANSQDETEQAHLHYELWRMAAGDEHAQAACLLYRRLYKQTPQYAFQRRLAELQVVAG